MWEMLQSHNGLISLGFLYSLGMRVNYSLVMHKAMNEFATFSSHVFFYPLPSLMYSKLAIFLAGTKYPLVTNQPNLFCVINLPTDPPGI